MSPADVAFHFSKWFKLHYNVMRKKWRKFLFLEMKWCLVPPIRASITSLKVNLAKSGSLFSMYTVQGITKIFLHTMTTILWRTTNLENLLVFIIIYAYWLYRVAQMIADLSKSEKRRILHYNYIFLLKFSKLLLWSICNFFTL